MRKFVPFVLSPWLLLVASLPAQGPDPMKEIEELARRVDEQLRDIDKMLLESGQKSQTRARQKELLQKAAEGSTSAEASIDELIEKLTQMKNQSSSQSQEPQDGQQGQQPQNGQQRPDQGQNQNGQNRRENQTPDFVQQPKPGEQQGQKPEPQNQKPGEQQHNAGDPKGGEEQKSPGENQQGNRPPQSETGPGQRGEGDETWGELQPYLNRLKSRGSSPKVPEKYRKYWEAYLKNKQSGGGK